MLVSKLVPSVLNESQRCIIRTYPWGSIASSLPCRREPSVSGVVVAGTGSLHVRRRKKTDGGEVISWGLWSHLIGLLSKHTSPLTDNRRYMEQYMQVDFSVQHLLLYLSCSALLPISTPSGQQPTAEASIFCSQINKWLHLKLLNLKHFCHQ